MKTKETKTFDSVAFFRTNKEKLAKRMEGMTLAQKKKVKSNLPDKELPNKPFLRKWAGSNSFSSISLFRFGFD